MGDQIRLCRLLSSIDDYPSSDETTFFEWARKTSSFSELVSAYRALQLLRRIHAVPQIEGEKPTALALGLWRSFVEKENTVVLMPSLVNIDRLPLLMCATYMHKHTSKHIVWLTSADAITATRSKLTSLVKSRNWALESFSGAADASWPGKYGATPTIHVISPDSYLYMLREGAPFSKVALLLISCTSDLLCDDAPYSKSLRGILERFSEESHIVRPKVCLLANNVDSSTEALSDAYPLLSSFVPDLSITTCSPYELESAISEIKQEPRSYLRETLVPPAFADSLRVQLDESIRKLLSLYVEEAETAALAGIFKVETVKGGVMPSPTQKRARYLLPLLPFHRHLEPIVLENSLMNRAFVETVDLIEQRWESCGAKLVLLAIRNLCTATSLLADVGISYTCTYLWESTTLLLQKISRRKASQTILDQLHTELTHLSSSAEKLRSEYLGTDEPSPRKITSLAQEAARRYKGRISVLLQLLTPFRTLAIAQSIMPLNDPSLPQIVDIYNCPTDFEVLSWIPRFIVHLSDPTLVSGVKEVIKSVVADVNILTLGDATDEVTCDEFFGNDSKRPIVLLSLPSSSRSVYERLAEHNKTHEASSHPKFIPHAFYGPYRTSSTSSPSSAQHPSFSADLTRNSVITIRLDSDSPTSMLKEMQTDEYRGQIIVSPKLASFSLSSALHAFHGQLNDIMATISSPHDVIADCRRTLDEIKAKQLRVYTPGAVSPAPTKAPNSTTNNDPLSFGTTIQGSRIDQPIGSSTPGAPPSSAAILPSKTLTPMPFIESLIAMSGTGATGKEKSNSQQFPVDLYFPGGHGGSFLDPWMGSSKSILQPQDCEAWSATSRQEDSFIDPSLGSKPVPLQAQPNQNRADRPFLSEMLDQCPTKPTGTKNNFGFGMKTISKPSLPQGSVKTPINDGDGYSLSSLLGQMDQFTISSPPNDSSNKTAPFASFNDLSSKSVPETQLIAEAVASGAPSSLWGVPSEDKLQRTSLLEEVVAPLPVLGATLNVPSSLAPNYTNRVLAALDISPSVRSETNSDPVSLLHIYFSKIGGADPEYDEILCGGTDHARNYRSTCTLSTGQVFEGWGMRKKDAKKAAAAYALEFITHIPAAAYFNETTTAPGSRPGPQGMSFPAEVPKRESVPTPISMPNKPSPNPPSVPSTQHFSASQYISPYLPQASANDQIPSRVQSLHPALSSHQSPLSFSSLSFNTPAEPLPKSVGPKSTPLSLSTPYAYHSSSTAPSRTEYAERLDTIPAYLMGSMSPAPGQSSGHSQDSSSSSFSNASHSTSSAMPTSSAPYDLSTAMANPIGVVNEYHQKRGIKPPVYTDAGRTAGSDHEPSFLCIVTIFDGRRFEARGSSKKEAKTNAAFELALVLGLVSK